VNQQNYVIAAFVVAAAGMIWTVLSSYFAMRKSEALADDLRQQN
jgi:hypothetical protein